MWDQKVAERAIGAIDTDHGRVREQMNDITTLHHPTDATADTPDAQGRLLDARLPSYDMVLTEHLVVEAETERVYQAAKNFDFMTTRSPFITAAMTARSLPSKLRGRTVPVPPTMMLARDQGVIPGWLVLGEIAGRELVFGAVGKFWKPDITWHELPADQFAVFAEPGWGKIACHLLVRPAGAGRSVLTYECRTATTDPLSRKQMARYWWLIRPFVAYTMRAVLRTIRGNVETRG